MKKTIPKLLDNSIRNVNKLLLNGETTVSALQAECSRVIENTRDYNPFITVCHRESSETANLLDDKLLNIRKSTGRSSDYLNRNNLLFGIPISIKDNFCTDQILTTCASKMLHNFIPNYTATSVSKLLRSDCLMMGKTNMDEFAMGSSSITSYYGPTANTCRVENLKHYDRHDESNSDKSWFMAGGSSTGSAVSVASGACFASLGSDTGGSTRQPASLVGIVGFKPTYGLISRFGLIPLAHCLDVVSILTRNIDDAEIVFGTIIGRDENDLTSVDHETHLQRKFASGNNSNDDVTVRIGIPGKFISKGEITEDVSDRFDQVVERMNKDKFVDSTGRSVNFEFVSLDLESSRLSTECYTIIASTEISSNMSCYDGVKYGHSSELDRTKKFDRDEYFKANRDEGFGTEVKKRILLGNYFLMSENREKYLDQATRLRRSISDEFQKSFLAKNVDIILTPSTPSTSISYQEWLNKQSDNKLFHEDYFLIPSNLANLPSISLPAGLSSSTNLPIGLQLIANQYQDLDLLYVSRIFEKGVLDCF